jgi:hypothetical protein
MKKGLSANRAFRWVLPENGTLAIVRFLIPPAGIRWFCISLWCLHLIAGCMVIPTPEHGLLAGRGEIKETDLEFLQIGTTTREDVLLRFGEPDWVSSDQCVLAFHWRVSKGVWLVIAAGPYGAGGVAGGDIPKTYLFMLEFNPAGRLRRYDISGSIWSPVEKRLQTWSAPDSVKRPVIIIDPTIKPLSGIRKTERAPQPIRFRIGEYHPLSANAPFLGHKKAAFGVIVADVWACRPAAEIVRSAIIAQLEAAGYLFDTRQADFLISVLVTEMSVTTALHLTTWDAIGVLDVTIKLQGEGRPDIVNVRRLQIRHVSKTLLGPSKNEFEEVLRKCLVDMQRQMEHDLVRLQQASEKVQ